MKAQGKGGKSDPAKLAKKDKTTTHTRHVLKASQAKSLISSTARMRVSATAAESLMYALTYLIIEIVDGAYNACVSDQKKKIMPKHINQCIAMDNELRHVGADWVIKSGGATGYLKLEDATLKKKKDE